MIFKRFYIEFLSVTLCCDSRMVFIDSMKVTMCEETYRPEIEGKEKWVEVKIRITDWKKKKQCTSQQIDRNGNNKKWLLWLRVRFNSCLYFRILLLSLHHRCHRRTSSRCGKKNVRIDSSNFFNPIFSLYSPSFDIFRGVTLAGDFVEHQTGWTS